MLGGSMGERLATLNDPSSASGRARSLERMA